MEQATEELLDKKTEDLLMTYIIQYDDFGKAAEEAGVTANEFHTWYKNEESHKRMYAFWNKLTKTIIRDPHISEPIAQWLENAKIEILPLLYNLDGLEDDTQLEQFIDKYNIHTYDRILTHPGSKHSRLEYFRQQLKILKSMIDKHLAGAELSRDELHRLRDAYEGRKVSITYMHSDDTATQYDQSFNPGSINIGRAYADMWDVHEKRNEIRRCEAPDCSKILVPRDTGGHKQLYHSSTCANRIRQRRYKQRHKNE